MPNGGVITAASVNGSNGGMEDRSATGLQFQRFQMGVNARGSTLGIGRRSAVDPNVLFTHTMSGAQFGTGTNPRSTAEAWDQSNQEEA
jgi:hypothetical protein